MGDPGVGKTAIAEGLARKIVKQRSAGSAARLHHLFARHGLADRGHALSRRFRGAAEIRGEGTGRRQGRHPVHRRNPHRDRRRRHLAAARWMPPTCSSRRWRRASLRCIGSTTYKEYRQYFEKDRALVRRFQKIDVAEPTVPDAIKILKGIKPYFEELPQSPLHRRRDQGGGGAVGEIHQRPQAARQGDRRDRRSRRLADAAAGKPPQEGDRRQGSGRGRRQDRAHSAQIRLQERRRSAARRWKAI